LHHHSVLSDKNEAPKSAPQHVPTVGNQVKTALRMDINTNWDRIRKHFNKSFSSNFYISVASVGSENNPTTTPIGSLFLNDDQTGFYFEKFPSKLQEHAKVNPKVCLLGVNSGWLFWIKSLFIEKFSDFPAIKLYGELGEKRKATEKEISRLNRRMKITNGLKGNTYLWKKMEFVREIKFTKAEKINFGKMTAEL
jgi:hypothetical protein